MWDPHNFLSIFCKVTNNSPQPNVSTTDEGEIILFFFCFRFFFMTSKHRCHFYETKPAIFRYIFASRVFAFQNKAKLIWLILSRFSRKKLDSFLLSSLCTWEKPLILLTGNTSEGERASEKERERQRKREMIADKSLLISIHKPLSLQFTAKTPTGRDRCVQGSRTIQYSQCRGRDLAGSTRKELSAKNSFGSEWNHNCFWTKKS